MYSLIENIRIMLRNIVENSGLRQKVWAEQLGVSQAYLSELMSGAKRPSLELAVRIEEATGLPVRSWVRPPREYDNGFEPEREGTRGLGFGRRVRREPEYGRSSTGGE